MNFIRLITQGPEHAFFNMALDEAISEAVRQKLAPPTLRLYRWDRPSLSLGFFQKVTDIDIDYCMEQGYPVVRRQTGGRAILHDSELTYSFSAPSDDPLFQGTLIENYNTISKALVWGLKMNNIEAKASFSRKRNSSHNNPACFKALSYGEITVDGKKIIGSAQKRYINGFLQHGSILLSFNAHELSRVLGFFDGNKFKNIAALEDIDPKISCSDLMKAFKKAFEKELCVKVISDGPTKFELDLSRELERNKYSTPGWNLQR